MIQRKSEKAYSIYRRQGLSIAKKNKRISWFKDSAEEHRSRVRDLVAILRNHRLIVHRLKTDRVGYVVYEYKYQIMAESFKGDCL
jgi:hypothetical protein